MRNQADAATEDEETIENTHAEIILSFFSGKGTAIAEEIDKADGDAAVDVEDQIVLFGSGDGLNGDGIVEEFVGSEVLHDEFFDQLHAEIGVGA